MPQQTFPMLKMEKLHSCFWLPTRRPHLKTKDQIRFKDRNHTSSRQGRLKDRTGIANPPGK